MISDKQMRDLMMETLYDMPEKTVRDFWKLIRKLIEDWKG